MDHHKAYTEDTDPQTSLLYQEEIPLWCVTHGWTKSHIIILENNNIRGACPRCNHRLSRPHRPPLTDEDKQITKILHDMRQQGRIRDHR